MRVGYGRTFVASLVFMDDSGNYARTVSRSSPIQALTSAALYATSPTSAAASSVERDPELTLFAGRTRVSAPQCCISSPRRVCIRRTVRT